MHGMEFGEHLKAVGRAGAGVNNIPVEELSKLGVPVFNAPGANANAVKELVVAGMLMAARNLVPALEFVKRLDKGNLKKQVEEGKKTYAGRELPGHTLGVIGLGKVGSLVADAAIRLGMNVLGYDPHITVEAAWSLPSQVRKAHSVDELLRASDFVSLHVPLVEKTKNLLNEKNLPHMKKGSVLLNFAREGIVDESALVKCLAAKHLRWYVTDIPSAKLIGRGGAAAPGRLDQRGRGQQRRDGDRPAARVPRERRYAERSQLPGRADAARVAVSPRDRQRQRAQHARAHLERDGQPPDQHP
jgi:D-3-phosphoglycerate dehydrogenase